ncbi:MAG: ATP-binding cassette domain-containing protein [Prevotellaceae bacterium]|jgi:cell division transport system ATP-binding protein|nr:ATP-binding cassette domain-containing protein [Prevotellaceae bacterium]
MNDFILDFNNVDVYQKDLRVLADVNFRIARGQFTYLIGRVGSGKSSLIKVINGELPVRTGDARVMDFQLNGLSNKNIPYLRRRIGVVFQDFQLLTDRSVYQNLQFVLKATGWTNKRDLEFRIDEVLYRVGLSDKKDSMPYRLSGGEQQRVAIARALLNNPEIILADEPTGNLDPDTGEHVMRIILDLSKETGITVLMATHNYNILKNFPARILKCENQRLSEAVMPSEEDLRNKLIKFGMSKGYEYELVYETVMKMYSNI